MRPTFPSPYGRLSAGGGQHGPRTASRSRGATRPRSRRRATRRSASPAPGRARSRRRRGRCRRARRARTRARPRPRPMPSPESSTASSIAVPWLAGADQDRPVRGGVADRVGSRFCSTRVSRGEHYAAGGVAELGAQPQALERRLPVARGDRPADHLVDPGPLASRPRSHRPRAARTRTGRRPAAQSESTEPLIRVGVGVHGGGIADDAILDRLGHRPQVGERRAQIVGDGDDQVAALGLDRALAPLGRAEAWPPSRRASRRAARARGRRRPRRRGPRGRRRPSAAPPRRSARSPSAEARPAARPRRSRPPSRRSAARPTSAASLSRDQHQRGEHREVDEPEQRGEAPRSRRTATAAMRPPTAIGPRSRSRRR